MRKLRAGDITAEVGKSVGLDFSVAAHQREVLQWRSRWREKANARDNGPAAVDHHHSRRPSLGRILEKVAVGQAQEVTGIIVDYHVIVVCRARGSESRILKVRTLHHH